RVPHMSCRVVTASSRFVALCHVSALYRMQGFNRKSVMRVLHPYLTLAPDAQRHRTCPCGAVAEGTHGLCRKCQARIAWRRKAMRKNGRGARRLAARHARTFVRLLADTMNRTPTSKGGEG